MPFIPMTIAAGEVTAPATGDLPAGTVATQLAALAAATAGGFAVTLVDQDTTAAGENVEISVPDTSGLIFVTAAFTSTDPDAVCSVLNPVTSSGMSYRRPLAGGAGADFAIAAWGQGLGEVMTVAFDLSDVDGALGYPGTVQWLAFWVGPAIPLPTLAFEISIGESGIDVEPADVFDAIITGSGHDQFAAWDPGDGQPTSPDDPALTYADGGPDGPGVYRVTWPTDSYGDVVAAVYTDGTPDFVLWGYDNDGGTGDLAWQADAAWILVAPE